MNRYILAIGTNLGDKLRNIEEAKSELQKTGEIRQVSRTFQTAPKYVEDQPPFYNLCLEFSSLLSPEELLKECKRIEREMGRRDGVRYGPREIDIDIIFCGDLVYDTPTLSIPHKLMHERAFVLVPLCDIAPEFIHPILHKNATSLKNSLSDLDTVSLL